MKDSEINLLQHAQNIFQHTICLGPILLSPAPLNYRLCDAKFWHGEQRLVLPTVNQNIYGPVLVAAALVGVKSGAQLSPVPTVKAWFLPPACLVPAF